MKLINFEFLYLIRIGLIAKQVCTFKGFILAFFVGVYHPSNLCPSRVTQLTTNHLPLLSVLYVNPTEIVAAVTTTHSIDS